MTSKPVLGIVCCTRTLGDEPVQAVANRYVEAATRHADTAALLVPSAPDLMATADIVPRLDGLLLTGSPSNVAPGLYGQADADDAEGPYDAARDTMTRELVERCVVLGKPVFGICRGLQELNVIFGGTLRRDTSRAADLLAHHAPAAADWDAMFRHGHEVTLTTGGTLARVLGEERIWVNSVHYQGVDQVGAGLRVEARAPDGIVEALSGEADGTPVIAVQWHPEWRTDANPQSQQFFRMLGRALRGQPVDAN